jgi:hypothetical protein
MNSTLLGLLFILAGLVYGSLAIDRVYNSSLGWLLANGWIKPENTGKGVKLLFGRKPTIILYSLSLIAIGIFILIRLE